MANHPSELDRSRYRCCCCHVNEGVLIIAILGVMFTWVYNPISWIAHVLLLVGYAAKSHRLYYSYVVLEFISCVFLVLAAILCVVDLVASSQSRVSLGYAWNDDPGGTQTLTLVFLFLFLLALVQQIWSIHVVRRAMEFLDEKEKLKKAKNQGFVATPNVFVAQQPIASYPSRRPNRLTLPDMLSPLVLIKQAVRLRLRLTKLRVLPIKLAYILVSKWQKNVPRVPFARQKPSSCYSVTNNP